MATDRLSILLLVRSLELAAPSASWCCSRPVSRRAGSALPSPFFTTAARSPRNSSAPACRSSICARRGGGILLPFFARVRRAISDFRADVVYSFLGGGNLVAAAARPFMGRSKMVWSIRASDMDLTRYDWLQGVGYAVERRLARMADLIIANSHAGTRIALANGFPAGSVVVVPNGIDTARFRPNPELRQAQRARWGLAMAKS